MGQSLSRLATLSAAQVRAISGALAKTLARRLNSDVAVVVLAGIITSTLWKLISWLRTVVYESIFTTVSVPMRSASFRPLLRWLQEQPAAWNGARLLVQVQFVCLFVCTSTLLRLHCHCLSHPATHSFSFQRHRGTANDDDDDDGGVDVDDTYKFIPAENTSIRLWYKGRLVWISTQVVGGSNGTSGMSLGALGRMGLTGDLRGMGMSGPRGNRAKMAGRVRRGDGGIWYAQGFKLAPRSCQKSLPLTRDNTCCCCAFVVGDTATTLQ